MRSRVELFEKIRRDRRLDDLSIRELADRHGVHRRTVRQALEDAVPPPRKVYPARPRPAIDEWATVIDAWLLADKDAPRKQRHTARRTSGHVLGGDGVALRGAASGRTRGADP
jgi:transcriptional regulator with XRE-family HTH domain